MGCFVDHLDVEARLQMTSRDSYKMCTAQLSLRVTLIETVAENLGLIIPLVGAFNWILI